MPIIHTDMARLNLWQDSLYRCFSYLQWSRLYAVHSRGSKIQIQAFLSSGHSEYYSVWSYSRDDSSSEDISSARVSRVQLSLVMRSIISRTLSQQVLHLSGHCSHFLVVLFFSLLLIGRQSLQHCSCVTISIISVGLRCGNSSMRSKILNSRQESVT